jgi:hypothetical protein
MRALVLPILLAACGGAVDPAPAPVPAPVPATTPLDRIATECRLLEAAQAETRARGLTAWPDVLAGCPGHPATSTVTLRQMSDATRAANAAALPAAARPLGPRADLIFRRMIARGVPQPVAEAMTVTPAFAAAAR